VGGIPEVVSHKQTGELVDYTTDHPKFESELTAAISSLMADPALLEKYGKAGRARAESEFGWDAVAAQTIALYKSVINN
jgi:alpha-maltose-1-phosphate synthase